MTSLFRAGWCLSAAMVLSLAVGCDDSSSSNGADAGSNADATVANGDGSQQLGSIVDIAAGNPDFSILVAAATRANLASTLGTAELTVFAPTNAAFEASGITLSDVQSLPVDQLTAILTYHAVAGRVPSSAVQAGVANSVGGPSLVIGTTGGVKLNGGNTVTGGANVVTADIAASNGIIHVIDRVLLPPTVADLARYAGLTTLSGAVESAELDDDLAGAGPFTVFAPTNAAFAELSSVPTGAALTNVLLYHVISGAVQSAAVPAKASTLASNEYDQNLTLLFNTSSGVKINGGANVSVANVIATNGVVHIIDKVLLPMNVVDAATAAGLTGLLGAVGAAADIDADTSVAEALSAQAPYTVFAPTNEAFTALGSGAPSGSALTSVLLYHVLDTTAFATPVLSTALPSSTAELKTLNGANATFTPGTPPTIEGADIVLTDIVVTNGVVHVIDSVIVPPTT